VQRGAIREKEIAQQITQVTDYLAADTIGKTCQYLSAIQNDIVKLAPLNKENLQVMLQEYNKTFGHLSFKQLQSQKLPLIPDYVESDTAFVDLKQCHDPLIQKNTKMIKKSGLIGGVISLLCFVTTHREDFDTIKEEKNAIVAAIHSGTSRLELEEKNSASEELDKSIVNLCRKSIAVAEQEIKKRDTHITTHQSYSLASRVTFLPPPMPSSLLSSSSSSSGASLNTTFKLPRPIPVRYGR